MSIEYGFSYQEIKSAIERVQADLRTHFEDGESVPWDTPATPIPLANFQKVQALARSQNQKLCKACGEPVGIVAFGDDEVCDNCSAFAIPAPCPKCGDTTPYEYSDFDLAFPNKIKVQICTQCNFAWNPSHKEDVK